MIQKTFWTWVTTCVAVLTKCNDRHPYSDSIVDRKEPASKRLGWKYCQNGGVRGERSSWHQLVTCKILQSLPGYPFLPHLWGSPLCFPVLYSSRKSLEGSDPSGPKLKLEVLLSPVCISILNKEPLGF